MPESFGARLRQRREAQGISLNSISEQTKIKLSLLEALERDDVSHWPSGIFRRAFIRAYAAAIGLNPDVVVREFLEVHPEPVEVAAPSAAMAARTNEAQVHSAPPTRLRTIMGSAIGSLGRIRRRQGDAATTAEGGFVRAATVEDDLPGPAPDAPEQEADGRLTDDLSGLPEAAAAPPRDSGGGPANIESAPQALPPWPDIDFVALAHLCTEFGRVEDATAVEALLQEAARILDAVGLIVWIWDPLPDELRPALVHGYSQKVIAQLPPVSRDADNATAAAFRSATICAMDGQSDRSGALAVPLVTPAGCGGVLAIELQQGREQTEALRAAATILAALLAQLTGVPSPAAAPPQADVSVPEVPPLTRPLAAADVRR